MKLLIYWVAVFVYASASAQSPVPDSSGSFKPERAHTSSSALQFAEKKKAKDNYFGWIIFSGGLGVLHRPYTGSLQTSFNYTAYDVNTQIQSNEIANLKYDFTPKNRYYFMFQMLGIEQNFRHWYVEAKLPMMIGKQSFIQVAPGVGYRCNLGTHKGLRVGVAWFYTSNQELIGRIDNVGKIINIYDITFYDKYYYTSGTTRYSSRYYSDANYINVNLKYDFYGIRPKISLDFYPHRRNRSGNDYIFRVFIGYNYVYKQNHPRLAFYQYGSKTATDRSTIKNVRVEGRKLDINPSYINQFDFSGTNRLIAMNGLFFGAEFGLKAYRIKKKPSDKG